MQTTGSKCAHPSCDCKVEGQNQFCSTACQASQETASGCACGHAGCKGSMASQGQGREAEVA